MAHDVQARGYLPLAALPGNVLLVPLDAFLATQVKQIWVRDPFAPLIVACKVEAALRELVTETL